MENGIITKQRFLLDICNNPHLHGFLEPARYCTYFLINKTLESSRLLDNARPSLPTVPSFSVCAVANMSVRVRVLQREGIGEGGGESLGLGIKR